MEQLITGITRTGRQQDSDQNHQDHQSLSSSTHVVASVHANSLPRCSELGVTAV